LNRGRTALLARLAILLLLAAQSVPAQTGPPLTREYFVRQDANQPLVIRVNPFEAEFRVQVSNPAGQVLKLSTIPQSRNLPVFLYIDGASGARQLDIRVDAPWYTAATDFELEFSRLDVRDDLSARLAEAYRLLAMGHEAIQADTAANWSVRVGMLIQAGRLFESFGMEELRLWALLSAAHLMLFELGDPNAALDLDLRVLNAARASGLEQVGLCALLLQGEVLFTLASSPAGDESAQAEALNLLQRIASRTATLDFEYERARAHFLGGQLLYQQGAFREALAQYERALDLALARQAMVLATAVREQMVEAHDQLGDVLASEEVLGSIVEQLTSEGADDDLVQGLLQQAALYLDLASYPEATAALGRSLAVDKVSLTRAQAKIMLGRAHYESGRFAEAEEQLRSALIHPESGLFRRPNPLLDLGPGLEVLANLQRHKGQIAEARRIRLVQSRHLDGDEARARWVFEGILDELAAGDGPAAGRAWLQGRALLRRSGEVGLMELAQLAVCAETSGPGCAPGEIRAAHEVSMTKAAPRIQVAAQWHWALYLARSGSAAETAAALSGLLEMIYFYRAELPGVLGAWYWTHRQAVFDQSLERSSSLPARGAAASLLAWLRIRAIGRLNGMAPPRDEWRAMVARGDSRLQPALSQARAEFLVRHAGFSAAGLERLLAALGPREMLLAIDLDTASAQIWLADGNGVRRRAAPATPRLVAAAARARTAGPGEALQALERLGRDLLAPVATGLQPIIYWLPMGHLLGVPLDAVRVAGRSLAEQHRVVALGGLSSPNPPLGEPGSPSWRVFLAGNPVDWSRDFPEQLSTTEEIAAVTGQFVGPGLHIVQANALLPDEFSDERLAAADIVHLAMPALIELGSPGGSWLELSESGRDRGRERLSPPDIRQWGLQGALVVISQSDFRGEPLDRFSSRLGLVDDLFEAGAAAVIASGRASGPAAAARFSESFYTGLRRPAGLLEAFSATRRAALREAGPGGAAAYQLYLR
jgi:tetratricopeptide (TPR) repeat protein